MESDGAVAGLLAAAGASGGSLGFGGQALAYECVQTAVWRIENGTPRRKITLDEALGFARVFELPLEELMSAPLEGLDIEGRQLVQAVVEAFYESRDLQTRLEEAVAAVTRYTREHPEFAKGAHEQYQRLTGDERIARHLTLLTEEGA